MIGLKQALLESAMLIFGFRRLSGKSMFPELKDGQLLHYNPLKSRVCEISRGDVVLIHVPTKDGQYYDLVKRVLGLPGETVEIANGKVVVNGVPIEESWLSRNYIEMCERYSGTPFNSDFAEVKLGRNEYFCLGDNRRKSTDSRQLGPFLRKQIFGVNPTVIG